MLAGRLPSLTAMIVACGRDEVSRRLVPAPLARTIRIALRLAPFGLGTHIALRTHAIDAVVRAQKDTRQLVLLGAGLDARAHRMPELADTIVFEVDHPSTQAYKRPRAADLPRVARAITYVAVDFERDDLGERLAAAGHDAGARSLFVWEGVTMYLTEDAIRSTLSVVAARSAPGSAIALTYAVPEMTTGSSALHAFRPLVPPAFAILGEPLRHLASPERIAEVVREHGFRRESDTGADDWARAAGTPAPTIGVGERLLVARRESD